MTLFDYYDSKIPEYYDTMYLDGYTPEQIMYAKHRQMRKEFIERRNAMIASKEAEPEVVIPNITFKSVVKIIK